MFSTKVRVLLAPAPTMVAVNGAGAFTGAPADQCRR